MQICTKCVKKTPGARGLEQPPPLENFAPTAKIILKRKKRGAKIFPGFYCISLSFGIEIE